MDFRKVKLENVIDGILEVAKLSFNKFYSKEKIYDRLKDKKYWIYVAEDKGKIIGFKIWYEDPSIKIYSWLGAVHPNYRRKGIATKLIRIQFDMAKKMGYEIVQVKTHDGHPEMISLLSKEGFAQTKIDQDHWGIGKDALFYEKRV